MNAEWKVLVAQVTSSRKRVSVSYEDLLLEPEKCIRLICEKLSLPQRPAMQDPSQTVGSFLLDKAEIGGSAPCSSGANEAMLWRTVAVPRDLSSFPAEIAKRLGYPVPMWKSPSATDGVSLRRLNSVTSLPRWDLGPLFIVPDLVGNTNVNLEKWATRLQLPCFLFDSAHVYQQSTRRVEMHAAYLLQIVMEASPNGPVLFGGVGLGCRVALEMALQFQRHRPHDVYAIVLVDGCVSGPVDLPIELEQYALFCAISATPLAPDIEHFKCMMRTCACPEEQLEVVSQLKPSGWELSRCVPEAIYVNEMHIIFHSQHTPSMLCDHCHYYIANVHI